VAATGREPHGGYEQDVLRRAGDASVLILTSLADGPKHGYPCSWTSRSSPDYGSDQGPSMEHLTG
jgi:hypothetical protein